MQLEAKAPDARRLLYRIEQYAFVVRGQFSVLFCIVDAKNNNQLKYFGTLELALFVRCQRLIHSRQKISKTQKRGMGGELNLCAFIYRLYVRTTKTNVMFYAKSQCGDGNRPNTSLYGATYRLPLQNDAYAQVEIRSAQVKSIKTLIVHNMKIQRFSNQPSESF